MLINNKTGGGRKSNIELLRLVSMLMVANLHSFWGTEHGEGILQALDFFREATSICAVDVFIIISGYFGIHWKVRSFFNLVFQVLFYCFAIYLTCVAIGVEEYSHKELIKQSFGLITAYGFITSYLILYFIAPLLNSFVEKVSSRELLVYIIILFLAENFVFHRMETNFFLLYLIGRFLNVSHSVENLKINAAKSYWMVTLLIFIYSYALFLRFYFEPAQLQSQKLIVGLSYAAPLVILQAVFLFLYFGRLNISNKYINWCASSCLAIFLIHMHPSVKPLYYGFTESLYDKPFLIHSVILILLFLIVFIGSILIDKLRIYISNLTYSILSQIVKKYIPTKFLLLETYLPISIKEII